MKLHSIKPAEGATKTGKRIGRGQGSGRGGTSTKGHKGQKSRSGYSYRPWFEGGQMPLQRRIPKFGFKNPHRVAYKVINLDDLAELIKANPGETIDHQFLADHGFIDAPTTLVKVLGRGEFTVQADVKLNKFSKTAKAAIEAAGGTATEV
ncbi:MAG: 50S ribosomal protein L15 [Bacteroidetes bacterium]|nr:MAG: 50S ribosomal protein L15 [Bacteroidota bacterium]